MKLEFVATDRLSDLQKNNIQKLRSAVYPPEVLATLPGVAFTWASPQWSVLAWDEAELVAKVGLLTREIISNGETKSIGGIGGVMTHPQRQGQGLPVKPYAKQPGYMMKSYKLRMRFYSAFHIWSSFTNV